MTLPPNAERRSQMRRWRHMTLSNRCRNPLESGGLVGEILNDRRLNLEKFQGAEEATLDLFAAVRNAYRQKRAKAIRE